MGKYNSSWKTAIPIKKQTRNKPILVKFTSSLLDYSYQFLRVRYKLAALFAFLCFERQIRGNKNPNFRLWTIGMEKYLLNLKPVPMITVSALHSKLCSHNC